MSNLNVIDLNKVILDLDAISRQADQALHIISTICRSKHDDLATAQFMLAGWGRPHHEIVAAA